MEAFKHEPIDLERPSFRLIRLIQGEWSPIRCELFQAWLDLDDLIPYEALSYVWGAEDTPNSIPVNGCPMGVTANLYLALQHLRCKDEDRILWIDAICIDQNNREERGHQVKHMAEIYKYAVRVVIWSGLSTDEVVVAMLAMEQLQVQSHGWATYDWKVLDERWESIWSSVWPILNQQGVGSITCLQNGMKSLLVRPWFKRVWILQEVAYARSAVFVCSRNMVSARFLAILPRLIGVEPTDQQQAVLDIIPGCPRNDSWWSENRELRFLLKKFMACEASDPRDKIYALLSMSTDARHNSLLQADYKKSENEVVQDAVFFLLSLSRSNRTEYPLLGWNISRLYSNLDVLANKTFDTGVKMWEDAVIGDIVKRKDFDMERTDKDGCTPLCRAAREGRIEAVRLLIDSGADTNVQDESGRTALIIASLNGHPEIVRLLIDAGADTDIRDGGGRTALIIASLYGHPEVVRLLIDAGADTNIRDESRQTALVRASLFSRLKVVRRLISARVDITSEIKLDGQH